MNWKSIRLELAGTPDFPGGSVSRSYHLRLPLREDGHIDEAAHGRDPASATARRFWPNEPDLSGNLVRTATGWAFSPADERCGGKLFHLDDQPIRAGGQVIVHDAHGRLPFRVARLEPVSRAI